MESITTYIFVVNNNFHVEMKKFTHCFSTKTTIHDKSLWCLQIWNVDICSILSHRDVEFASLLSQAPILKLWFTYSRKGTWKWIKSKNHIISFMLELKTYLSEHLMIKLFSVFPRTVFIKLQWKYQYKHLSLCIPKALKIFEAIITA